MTSDRYELRLSAGARRDLSERLPPRVAFAVWEFCRGPLRDNPYRVGRPLGEPFEGCFGARRGSYRVRYEIFDDVMVVNVIAIVVRADAYNPRRA